MRRLLAFGFVLAALPVFAQAPTVTVSGDGAATVVSIGTQGPAGPPGGNSRLFDVLNYGALGDVRSVADAAISQGSTTLTSATAAFVAADTGKLVTVAMGARFVSRVLYSSGLTVTGATGDTCTFSAFDGGGSGTTATAYLTGTDTIAASTPLLITAQGTGYTTAPTTATVASGTATCSGTPVLVGTIRAAAIQSTATHVNATTITLSVAATTAVSGGYMSIGTDDTTAIQAAVTAAQAVNGTVYIPHGTYQVTSAITVAKGVHIEGDGVYPYYGSRTGNPFNSVMPTQAPYMTGSVLLVTKPNTDGLYLTVVGESVHLAGIGIRFDDTFAFLQTGHGIHGLPPLDGLGEQPDLGVFGGNWNNLAVWGHDGNHYAFELINTQYMTVASLQAWGGGGMELYAHANWVNPGNNVFVHPYFYSFVGGSAHGYYLHLTTTGVTDGQVLNYFARPQSIMGPDPVLEPMFSRGASSINGQQCVFVADTHTHLLSLDSPDFEALAGCSAPMIAGVANGWTDNMWQAGGTTGFLRSRFLHAYNGTLEIYDNGSTTVPVTTISEFGNTITAPSTTFTSGAVLNQAVNVFSPTGGNTTLRLGDSLGATRKEFFFMMDMVNNRADIEAYQQGAGPLPLRLNPSGGQVLFANGTAAAPSLASSSTPGTGIYFDASSTYFPIGGILRWAITNPTLYFAANDIGVLGSSGYQLQTAYLSRGLNGGKPKALTDGAAATTFVQFATFPQNSYVGGELICTATSTDATDYRSLTERIRYSAVSKGTAVTGAVGVIGTDLLASSNANTLVCTWSEDHATASILKLQVTCTDNTAGNQTIVMNCRRDEPIAFGGTVTYP